MQKTKEFIIVKFFFVLFLVFGLFVNSNASVSAATDLPLWANSVAVGASGASYFNKTATDHQGNIYVAGYVDGTAVYNLGNGVTVSGGYSGGHNAVLVKYNSAGVAQWANSTALGGSYHSNFSNLTIDDNNNIYTVGYITGKGTFNLGNGVTVVGGTIGDNAVIAKYNSDGLAQWAKSTTSGANTTYYGVVIDNSGNLFAAGMTGSSTTNFGNGVTAAGGSATNNGVIVKYNSSGTTQWAKTTASGAPGASNFYGLAIDSNNNLYAVGNIGTTGTFGFGNSVTVSGGYNVNNAVIIKYNSDGLAQWAKSTALGGPANSFFYGVAVDASNNPYAVGFIYNTGTFNLGNSVTVNGGYSTYNAIVAKYDSDGLAQWANSTALGGPSSSYFYDVAIDANDFVYCSGQISSTGKYDFGNSITVNAAYSGGYNAAFVKYSSAGLAQMVKSTTVAPSTSNFNGISVDSDGKIYAVGSISSALSYNFGNSTTVSGGFSGGANVVIVKYDTEAIVPTPTPTPTPARSENTQNNSSSSSTTPSAPVCTDIKPLSVPDLFQINVTDTTAKIFFTPTKETNNYYASFSEDPDAQRHGASATLLTEGVQSYTIFYLKPNTTYYFKVRAQSGCIGGDWSNTIKIKTNPKSSLKINIFYKDSSLNKSIIKIKNNKPIKNKDTPIEVTPIITATPQKEEVIPNTAESPKPETKKFCILKWCF